MESKPTRNGIFPACTEYLSPERAHHREDGPAIIFDTGTQVWVQHGKWHRLDGPAIENCNGIKKWYANGRSLWPKLDIWAEEMGIDLNNLSEDDKVLIAMVWSDYGK